MQTKIKPGKFQQFIDGSRVFGWGGKDDILLAIEHLRSNRSLPQPWFRMFYLSKVPITKRQAAWGPRQITHRVLGTFLMVGFVSTPWRNYHTGNEISAAVQAKNMEMVWALLEEAYTKNHALRELAAHGLRRCITCGGLGYLPSPRAGQKVLASRGRRRRVIDR